jgi:protoporphyrinogen oxidase
MYTILGAGLAGLSCSYHLDHENCVIFEGKSHAGGHIYSHHRDGFVWDEGPHVSFTQNAYVRDLFEQSVKGRMLDYPVEVSNYFHGSWIPHPAQSNLFAAPEALRDSCLDDFLKTRNRVSPDTIPRHYGDWLEQAFGPTFAATFPSAYTRKYWTVEPACLTTDWVGSRVFYPDVETVVQGSKQAPTQATHYIKTVRYPASGGYMAFADALLQGARIHSGHQVVRIDLKERKIEFSNGKSHVYEELVSTIPLPEFVRLSNAPSEVQAASERLCCTSLLLVNVTANHPTKKPFHWMYVYDEDKLSTRINCVELLSPNNAPVGKTGVQVEVYESRYKPLMHSHAEVAQTVCAELIEMGLIDAVDSVHTQYIPYANVIFDHPRRESQDIVLGWLEQHGLIREDGDLDPMTAWDTAGPVNTGHLALAGRFGQWKYYWTDDCVLRGRYLAQSGRPG